MKEKYIAPSAEIIVWAENNVMTLSTQTGDKDGTAVLVSWLIG